MQSIRVAAILRIVANWGDDVFDEARALEGDLAEAAADALADAMLATDSMSEALADSGLSDAEEQLRAVATMEREVTTGGFIQFLDSCGHAEGELAAQGCERIGAERFTPLVERALAIAPEAPEDDWPQELRDALDVVDDAFYDAYQEVEELLKLRLAYAAAHPDEFRALRSRS